jgi:RNA polymerase sigma-70 factor (ECF subfamily)
LADVPDAYVGRRNSCKSTVRGGAGQTGISQVGVEHSPDYEETRKIAPPPPSSIHLRRKVERWYLEFRDPVFRYLRTLGCHHAMAEEITQECFLRLHSALRDGAQVNDVRAWLFRVARNLLIDHRRQHQRHWITEPGDTHPLDMAHSDLTPDPEQQVLLRERIRLIEEELARLPEQQRNCILLKAQGLPYHEIAAILGISMTAAVDCVRRTVRRLGRRFHT